MTFTGFVVQEHLRLVVIRVQEGMPICTNKWLWAAVSFSLFMQAIIVYTPIGSAAFDTVPLGLEQWGILLAGLAVGFAVAIVTAEAGRAAVRPAVGSLRQRSSSSKLSSRPRHLLDWRGEFHQFHLSSCSNRNVRGQVPP